MLSPVVRDAMRRAGQDIDQEVALSNGEGTVAASDGMGKVARLLKKQQEEAKSTEIDPKLKQQVDKLNGELFRLVSKFPTYGAGLVKNDYQSAINTANTIIKRLQQVVNKMPD